ncbi:NACHT domain-containing protein [Aquabacterium parvum]|jgi:hypothetical protein|uniref:NACHT domain-containing protein n=1 Tax=Aquabacterium parvum TaxID=70584 RepID=UPI000718F94B|nr:NACHT domain-containing protein [Aquabacterium parvum]MBU0915441.1 hypothetical protein [Gammaproteobacteria bacterium]
MSDQEGLQERPAMTLQSAALVYAGLLIVCRGLCDPMLPSTSNSEDILRTFRVRLEQAVATLRRGSADRQLVLLLDAIDNASEIARDRHQDSFPRLLLQSLEHGAAIAGLQVVVSARTHRRLAATGEISAEEVELAPFVERETRAFLRARLSKLTETMVQVGQARSKGNARVLETPHLRVDWRFNGVRFCMLHQCMLEDVCAVCSSPLRMPFDMAESGPSGEGTAYLRQCQTCGHDLADVQTVDHVDMRFELTSYEASLLRHGVAMMAALYHDRCDIADGGSGARFKVRLRDLWRMQMLPIRVPHLCADLMRERIASPFASDQGGQMPAAAADEGAAINEQGTLL